MGDVDPIFAVIEGPRATFSAYVAASGLVSDVEDDLATSEDLGLDECEAERAASAGLKLTSRKSF